MQRLLGSGPQRAMAGVMVLVAALGGSMGESTAQQAQAPGRYPEPPPLLSAPELRAQLARKRELQGRLQQEARRIAGQDSVRYNALLREGMARIEQQLLDEAAPAQRGERSFSQRSVPAPVAFHDLRGKVEEIDLSPAGRQQTQTEFARPRIAGGVPTKEDELPEVVALRGIGLGSGRCTGVRVGRGTILTAAHCFCHGAQFTGFSGEVVFGQRESGSQRFKIQGGALLMQGWCAASKQSRIGRDLAVVHFSEDAPGAMATIMNPVADYLHTVPASLVVAGFGRTGSSGSPQGTKLKARVMMSSRLCVGANDCIPGRELKLADPNGIADTCPGDSGGPAFHVEGGWFLTGITSRGTLSPRDCGDGGIYTIVNQSVIRWLCGMGVVPIVHLNDNPCGLAGTFVPPDQASAAINQRTPEAAVPPAGRSMPVTPTQPPESATSPSTRLPAQPPSGRNAAAAYIEQCRLGCPSSGWECTEQCTCRLLCETRGDPSACQKFCAPN